MNTTPRSQRLEFLWHSSLLSSPFFIDSSKCTADSLKFSAQKIVVNNSKFGREKLGLKRCKLRRSRLVTYEADLTRPIYVVIVLQADLRCHCPPKSVRKATPESYQRIGRGLQNHVETLVNAKHGQDVAWSLVAKSTDPPFQSS